ncbi:MAG TPA: hypothetical protein VL171_05575 [Verrucomicrobiae bacterium]|nr:hypothetical protein [Verrucomicrobiae bacterium]
MRVLLALLLVGLAFNTQAASIEARLVRGSNDTKAVDSKLQDLEPKLKKQFGYEYYQQLGVQKARLQENKTRRLNLGEGFVLFVTPKSIVEKVHELDLEWTSGRASLVKTTVRIPEGDYLFIKGPAVADDWILLVVTVHGS